MSDISYADIISEDTQDRESHLRLSIQQGMKQDPEAAARAQRIARERGIPSDTVARNLPKLQAEIDAESIDYSGIIANNESLADFLSNPENAAIAHDDIGALAKVSDYGRAFAGDAVQALASGAGGMGSGIDAAAVKLRRGAENVGVPKSVMNALDAEIPGSRFITQTFRGEIAGAKNYGESLKPAKERRGFGTDVAGALGQVASNILTYAVNPTVATGLMFGQGADQQAERINDARMKGKIVSASDEANAVLLGGAATAATERVELGFLMKGVPGVGKLVEKLPAGLQKKWLSVPIGITAAGIAEGSQEVIEGLLHDTVEYYSYNPDVKFFQDVRDDFAVSGTAGAAARALIMAIGGARKHMAQERVVGESDTLKAQAQAARESKLQQRAPEKFREYIKTLAGGSLYMDPDAGTSFYQSLTDDDRARLDAAVPDFAARVEESKATGADIEVGHDEYLAHIAPLDAGETLAEHLKRQPDGFSAMEALEMQDAVEEMMAPTEGEALERRLYDNIVNTGMTPDAARIQARKFRDAYETLSERVGENPELLRMVDSAFAGLEIREQGDVARGKFDDLDLLIGEAQSFYRTKSKKKRAVDLLGDKAKTKEAATPRPLLNYLIEKGGIDRYGMVAGELRNIGITPENTPRLFNAKGKARRDIDNLVAQEFNNAFSDRDVVAVEDGNGYVDRQWLLDQLRDESFGRWHKTAAERERDERIGYYEEIYNTVGRAGYDLLGSSKEDIRRALEQQDTEDDSRTLYQGVDPEFKLQYVAKIKRILSGAGGPNDPINRRLVDIGIAPLQLQALGLAKYPVQIPPNILRKARDKHSISDAVLQKLPEHLNDPLAIIRTNDPANPDAHVFAIEAKDAEDRRIIMILKPDAVQRRHVVTSIYGRNNDAAWFNEQIEQGRLLYVRNEEGLVRLRTSGKQYPGGKAINPVHGGQGLPSNVMTEADIVKRYGKKTQFQGDEKGARGKITFQQDKAIITLFKNKNLSTLLHESGHFYWNLLNDLAAMPNAPDQIKRDAAAVRAWVKAEEGQILTVEQEEKIARGFEAYLMEGKAPSIELRSAFRSFKAWLLRIYRRAESLQVELTSEVRGVFDRLLATDEAIDRARRNPVFQPDPAIMEMLSPAEQDKYVKKASAALEEAKDTLFRKALHQESRKQTKWWKENWAEVEAQQAAILNQQNIYRAIFSVTKGETPDGQKLEKRLKLNRKAVEDAIGKEMAKQLPAGSLDRDGVNPSLVADLFNLGSAQEMLFKMAEADKYAVRLKAMTEEVMRVRHGDMLNDGTIEREALEAMHNDLGAAQAEAEYHAVLDKSMRYADRPSNYRPKREVFENIARGMIDRTQIQKLQPHRYYRAEVRAAKKAGEAIAKQDWKTAAEAKKQQLLNHYLYRIAKEELADIDKRITKWSRLDKSDGDLAKTLDIDYVYAARYVLSKYGIGKVTDFTQWQEQLQREDPGKLEELMAEIGVHVASAQDYREMDLFDFEGLADSIDFILTKAKTSKVVSDGKNQMQLDDFVGILYKALDDEFGARERSLTPARDNNPVKDFISDVLEAGTQINTVIEKLDGGVANGIIDRFIRQPIREGEALCALREKEAADKLLKLMNKYYGKAKVGEYTVTQENLVSKSDAVFIRDISRSMTREEVISVALNWGNEDNRVKLRAGRPEFGGEIFGDAGLEAVLRKMRKQDWEFVQDVWDLIDSYWPEISALERKTKGAVPQKVEALPFTSVNDDGEVFELRGGYFPLKYDAELSIKTTEDTVNEEFKLFALGRNAVAATRRGHTKERVDGVRRPVRLDGINVIREHLSSVIRDLTLREPIQNAHKILSHKSTREAFENTMGPRGHRMFDIWLKDTAVGRVMSDRGLTSRAAGARHSTTIAAMGWKLSTALVQITGLSQSVVELRPKWAFKGLQRSMELGLEAAGYVQEKSEFMRARGITFNRDVGDAMKRLEQNGILRDVQATFMLPMLKMQQVVDTITWLGAYEKAVADDRPGGDPVKYADQIVENAQSSGAFSAMSPILRGTLGPNTRLNEWIKLYTVFMSYFNTKVNLAMRRTNQTNFKKPEEVARLGLDYLMLFWFETVVGDFILGKLPDFGDDEEPAMSAAAYSLKASLSTFMAGLPVLREAAAFMSGFGTTPPHVRGIEGTVAAGKNVGKVISSPFTDEEINWYKVARSIVDAGVYLSPVKYPAGQINVMIKAMEQSSEGEDVAPADYLIAPPRK